MDKPEYNNSYISCWVLVWMGEVEIKHINYSALAVNNEPILEGYFRELLEYVKREGHHIEFGHGKNLKFQVKAASYFKTGKVAYYDNAKGLEKLLNLWNNKTLKRPKNMKRTRNPAVVLKKNKIEGFDSAGFFFTIHEFFGNNGESPRNAIKEAYELLLPGGTLMVVDYDMKHLRGEHKRQKSEMIVRAMFEGTENERSIMNEYLIEEGEDTSRGNGIVVNIEGGERVEEVEAGVFQKRPTRKKNPLYEPDWFEAHTRYSLAGCVIDAENAGFEELFKDYQPRKMRDMVDMRKLFLYVGRKPGSEK